jgi:hypothetical protein
MSPTPTAPSVVGVAPDALVAVSAPAGAQGPRRVRHQARDAVALMAFSAAASTAVAGALLLLTQLSPAGR